MSDELERKRQEKIANFKLNFKGFDDDDPESGIPDVPETENAPQDTAVPESTGWLYATAGDILSSSLQYLSIKKAMQEGLTIKKYYDMALEEDPGFVFCLINIGQWYFHAPVVSGGGKGKALNAFKKAESSAKNDIELYYAKLYLSQSYYEDGNKKKAAELLEECEALLPGSGSVKLFKKLNENGYHYFEYPENRRKIDSKLAKKAM